MSLFEVNHPLIKHHLSRLRDRHTPPAEFRQVVQRLAALLAYEATKDLAIQPIEIETPLTRMTAQALAQRIGLIPILRAGLGMVDPILNLIPTAEVWHLGLYRDETTARPVEYYSKLPQSKPVDVALVVDPMLATGGSATAALATLQRWGVGKLKILSIIASKFGLEAVQQAFPAADIYVCAIDPELNDQKFIVPGLGDAGDRIFNTNR
jgi:uracil phosphoribosyltransferase